MLDIIWLLLIMYLVIIGIYFSFKIKFTNYSIKSMFKKVNKDSLFLALGSKMGVGSIIGITMSICIGGPGSIFWIYIFSFLTSSIVYVESFLGSKYKQLKNNSYTGGIFYYTKYGLKNNVLAIISLIIFVSTYSFFFLMIQTNTITNVLNINKYIIFFILLVFIILIITNNINEIRNLTNKLVPSLCIFFISISIYVLIKNINILPFIINNIITNAFNTKSFFIGMIIGIKRSIFLNELLIGTTSMSSGINDENEKNTSCTLVLGSYFISFIITTLMAFLVLIYINHNSVMNSSYIELLINVFNYHFNSFGKYFLSILIILLSMTTIISGMYIGISNIEFITNNIFIKTLFKIFMIIFILSGVFINNSIIWNLIDTMMLIIIIINSYVIIKLRNSIS